MGTCSILFHITAFLQVRDSADRARQLRLGNRMGELPLSAFRNCFGRLSVLCTKIKA
jgi:hypothetical protein